MPPCRERSPNSCAKVEAFRYEALNWQIYLSSRTPAERKEYTNDMLDVLWLATKRRHPKVERALLIVEQEGWERVRWAKGYSLLHCLAETADDPLVLELVARLVPPDQLDDPDDAGFRPIDYARQKLGRDPSHRGVVDALEKLRQGVRKDDLPRSATPRVEPMRPVRSDAPSAASKPVERLRPHALTEGDIQGDIAEAWASRRSPVGTPRSLRTPAAHAATSPRPGRKEVQQQPGQLAMEFVPAVIETQAERPLPRSPCESPPDVHKEREVAAPSIAAEVPRTPPRSPRLPGARPNPCCELEERRLHLDLALRVVKKHGFPEAVAGTPLHVAAELEDVDAVTWLLTVPGASMALSRRDEHGKRPIDYISETNVRLRGLLKSLDPEDIACPPPRHHSKSDSMDSVTPEPLQRIPSKSLTAEGAPASEVPTVPVAVPVLPLGNNKGPQQRSRSESNGSSCASEGHHFGPGSFNPADEMYTFQETAGLPQRSSKFRTADFGGSEASDSQSES
mmetsp:Transcript_30120/g.70240  ORF Transcript_30120/g.70240 Transcript_30120/m.70240 type:complete len:509 (+) Transcript_30120:105-1631(+)